MITFRALGGVLLLCLALYRPILAFFEPALVFIEPALACIDTLLARIGPDVSMIYALLKGGKKKRCSKAIPETSYVGDIPRRSISCEIL